MKQWRVEELIGWNTLEDMLNMWEAAGWFIFQVVAHGESGACTVIMYQVELIDKTQVNPGPVVRPAEAALKKSTKKK